MSDLEKDPLASSADQAAASGAPSLEPKPVASWQRIFIGPEGSLRPGWRFLLYLIAFAALQAAIEFTTRPLFRMHGAKTPPLWAFLAGELTSFVAALVPAFFLAQYVENRPFGAYGLPLKGAFGRQFWMGVAWGIGAISLLLFVMRGMHTFYFGGLAEHGLRILKFGAFWAVLFLVVGLFEEFVTRGYTQFTLAQGMGFWPAAFLLSFIFGALHFPQEYALGDRWGAWAGSLGAASIGLFFCLTLRRTGALWFAVGMHASWDWGESFLYSTPDSGTLAQGHLLSSSFHGKPWLTGGPVGPEASVLVFVLIALMWVVFDRIYPARKGVPDQPLGPPALTWNDTRSGPASG
ncbi:MAG: CPBP family intramembrane metalloprotease [Acidobacteria bacterium]|nr:CPBP family intramembrane metalloprotease [Acidobacteriota bacterium]